MSKFLTNLILICLAFNVITACAGTPPIGPQEILNVTSQQAVTGVYAALTGADPLAQVLRNSVGTLKVAWPGPSELWSFTMLYRSINAAGTVVYTAADVKCGTAEAASVFMGGTGWKKVASEDLPFVLAAAKVAPISVILQTATQAMPTILTIPVFAVPTEVRG